MIEIEFRGMRWQTDPLRTGPVYAQRHHNAFRRNLSLEPLKSGDKATAHSGIDLTGIGKMYRFNDRLIVASNPALQFFEAPNYQDEAQRLYFVENSILQFLPDNEIPSNTDEANTTLGHRAGVAAPPASANPVFNYLSGIYVAPADQKLDAVDTLDKFETRLVYTYVNKYGEEGPPSIPSAAVEVSRYEARNLNITRVRQHPATHPDIVGMRVYMLFEGQYFQVPHPRLTDTASGITDLTFIYDAVAGPNSQRSATIVVGPELTDLLVSENWYELPNGIKHAVPLDGDFVVAASDYQLYFSEPGYTHAWPPSWRRATQHRVLRLEHINGGFIVCHEQGTDVYVATHPTQVTRVAQFAHPIRDPLSMTRIDDSRVYVADEGIVLIEPGSAPMVVTDGWIDKEQWLQYVNPAHCRCAAYEGRLIVATRLPVNDNPIGYMINLAAQEVTSFDTQASEVDIGFYRDPLTTDLYSIADTSGIAVFNRGSPRGADWQSGPIVIDKAEPHNALRVDALAYPVTVGVTNREGVMIDYTIQNAKPIRIQSTGRTRRIELRAITDKSITRIRLGRSLSEVA